MADYQPLILRAVEALPAPEPDLRQAVYGRAREALVQQLRTLNPPLAEADIDRERRALDDAIERVEADYAVKDAGPDAGGDEAAPAVPLISPSSEPEAPERPQERLETWLPRPQGGPRVSDEPKGEAAELAAPLQPAELPPAEAPSAVPAEPRPPEAAARGRPVVAPRPAAGGARRLRAVAIGGVLALILGLVGTTAYLLRDDPAALPAEPIAPETPPAAAAAPSAPDAKRADRVGGERLAPPPPAPPATEAPTPAGGGGPAVAVAQRAALIEENASDPRNPLRQTPGRVVWRLDSLNPGQGKPLETVVRASIEIFAAEITMNLLFRRNTDPTLPASHTVEVGFRTAADRTRAVRDIGALQAKSEEGARGTPVAGLQVRVDDNLFLIGLSNLPQDQERNLDLLTRPYFDVPIILNSGQRAIVSFEKGISGDQVMAEALRRWR